MQIRKKLRFHRELRPLRRSMLNEIKDHCHPKMVIRESIPVEESINLPTRTLKMRKAGGKVDPNT